MLGNMAKILQPVQPASKRRSRVVRGTFPNSYGSIVRKPGIKTGYQLLQDSNIRYRQYSEAKDQGANRMTGVDNHIRWEEQINKKMVATAVKREMQCKFEKEEKNLEQRQFRLRKLLYDEENYMMSQIASTPVTIKERKELMHKRANYLREKREEERKKLVLEKLDQQFRLQCDPLRAAISKRIIKEAAYVQQQNLGNPEIVSKEKKMIDDFFEEIRLKEYQRLTDKEEKENEERKSKNQEVANILRSQMALLEENKRKADKLKEEEFQLMNEQTQLHLMAEKMALEEKRRSQKETKEILDKTVKKKQLRKAKAEREQLESDIKILETIVEKCEEENQMKQQRKLEHHKETQTYLKYVRELLTKEEARKIEVENVIREDIENQWQKRLNQWRKDREMRRILMDDVMRIRGRQVMDKLVAINVERTEAETEKEEVLREIELNKEREAEEIHNVRQKKLQYNQDLLGQIDFNKTQQQILKDLEEESYKRELQVEEELKKKVDDLVNSDVDFCKQHPLKLALSQMS